VKIFRVTKLNETLHSQNLFRARSLSVLPCK